MMSEKSDYQKYLESMSEIEYKRLTQGNWSKEHDTRVRCTADGEFPEDGEVVYYEIYDVHYFGKFLEKEATISRWKDFSDEQPYDWYKLDVPIYWKPLTSLKDEYERQKESEW